MLTRFKVRNYKCLADVDLPLTPVHVVIGQNDSGKTSLLEAILALSRTATKPLAEAFLGEWRGRELVSEWADRPEVELKADFTIDEPSHESGSYGLRIHFGAEGRKCAPVAEQIVIGGKGSGWASKGPDTWLYEQSLKEYRTEDAWILHRQMGPAQAYRFDPTWMAMPAGIEPSRRFRMDVDGFGLPTLLDDILGSEPEKFIRLRDEFCAYFPQFRSVRVETESGLAREYDSAGSILSAGRTIGKGIYLETKGGARIRSQQASDGAMLFLGLLALTYTPTPPRILLIEEPEKGVYPKRLEEIIALLRKMVESRRDGMGPQVIITTHSPYLLSSFSPEEVTLLSRRGESGPVQARPLRDAPHIYERLDNGAFYLGELWYNLSEEELFADA